MTQTLFSRVPILIPALAGLLLMTSPLPGSHQETGEPSAILHLRVIDSDTRQPTAVRVEVLDNQGVGQVAEDALLVGGDPVDHTLPWTGTLEEARARLRNRWMNFDTGTVQFYSDGTATLDLKPGAYRVTVSKGFEYRPVSRSVELSEGGTVDLDLPISRWIDFPAKGWYGADSHIHVARTHPELDPLISKWMQAEDIHVATLLQWGNLTGFHNAPQYDFGPDSIYREGNYLLASGQENPRTHLFGHTIILGASSPIDFRFQYLIYRLFWEEARRQGALSGYAHMGVQAGAQNGLAIDLPLNLLSFLEVLQFNNADYSVWYNILNTGFAMAPTAGSDYPFGGSPLGRERFYTRVEGPLTYAKWLQGIAAGRTFVTNGPFLEFSVDEKGLGEEVRLERAGPVRVRAKVRFDPSRDDVQSLEIVSNGVVVRRFDRRSELEEISCDFQFEVDSSGWLAVRSKGQKVGLKRPIPSLTHSGAIYLSLADSPSRAEHPRARALARSWATRLSELDARLASQYDTMALSRWDEGIPAGYVLKQREELRKAVRWARDQFLIRAGDPPVEETGEP